MASAKAHIDLEKHLACPICMEIFSDPRALPCLHTFCLKCLQSYIGSLKFVSDNMSFECPVCRKRTNPPSFDLSKNIWAENFPSNYTIKALLEDTEVNGTVYETSTGLEPEQQTHGNCRHHVTKMADFLCADHTVMVCSICVALHHRKCVHVIYLGTDSSLELQYHTKSSLDSEVLDLLEDTNLHIPGYARKSSNSDNNKGMLQNKAIHNQGRTKRKGATILDDTAREVESKSDLRNVAKMNSEFKRLNMRQIGSQEQLEQTQRHVTSDGNVASDASFSAFKSCLTEKQKQGIANSKQQQRTDNRDDLQAYSLCGSTDTLIEDRALSKTDVKPISSQLKQQDEFSVRVHDDQNYCSITGITCFPRGLLLLADESNKKLKLFNSTGEHVCHLNLTSAPWDVTSIEEFEAAVTLPVQNRVQLVFVDNCILKTREIQLEKPCYGISYWNQQFFVAMEKEVQILAYSGEILKKLNLCDSRKKRFSFSNSKASFDGARYLSIDNHSKTIVMYVSCAGYPGMIAVEIESGDIKSVSQGDAGRILGVSVCTDGRVLFCQSPGRLMIVSKHQHGSLIKELLQVEKLQIVHFDHSNGNVYLSQRLNDCFRVYKF